MQESLQNIKVSNKWYISIIDALDLSLVILLVLVMDSDCRQPSRVSVCSQMSVAKGQQTVGECCWFVNDCWCLRWLLLVVGEICSDHEWQIQHQPPVMFNARFYQTSPEIKWWTHDMEWLWRRLTASVNFYTSWTSWISCLETIVTK